MHRRAFCRALTLLPVAAVGCALFAEQMRWFEARARELELKNERALIEMYPPLIVRTPVENWHNVALDMRAGSVNMIDVDQDIEILGWNGTTFEFSKERGFGSD
jgi:hypothetical protein